MSLTLKGLDGVARIAAIMKGFRENTPEAFAGVKVASARDYKTQIFRDIAAGTEIASPLPVSDVLQYILDDGAWICIRPSGTEPKLKFYFGVKADSLAAAEEKIKAMKTDIEEKVEKI